MTSLPLLGIRIVIAGFALKLNPMLVVTVAAIATGLIAGMDPVEVISTFGKAFNDNRIIAIVWIVLPVIGLLERFAIRRGSGGGGRHRGGDGVLRHIHFRERMRANILSNRREVPPAGLAGGTAAQPGINQVVRADGTVETLGATASAEMRPGDMFVIETPGGGGFGAE